jgi:hypothetical protein
MSASREDIIQHFIKHVSSHGKKPDSVYTFMDSMDAKEEEFYNFFQSVADLEKNTWLWFFETTLSKMQVEDAYAEYSVREKMLSFFFTIVEMLKPHREFALHYKNASISFMRLTPGHMLLAYEYYVNWVKQLVEEGTETGEIADRSLINQRYPDGLWVLVLSILKYWLKDESEDYDKTDTFIEKYVNFNFDMLGVTPLDSGLDFAKFVIQEMGKKTGNKA